MHILRTMNQALIECLQILNLHTFHIGIHQDRGRVVADHTTTMTGARPLGEETTLLVSVDQALLHLLINRGEHQVQEGEEATERIPETTVRVHVTRTHLAVVGAIMHHLTVRVDLIELTREKQRAVHTRIEGTVLIQIATLYLNLAKQLVPALLTLLHQRVE